jgi:hypothetical protein
MKKALCYICEKEYLTFEMRRVSIGWDRQARWICSKCDKKRCERCKCILNNKFDYGDWGHYTKETLPLCKICHEEPYKEPEISAPKTREEYYKENREKLNEYQRKWYRENKMKKQKQQCYSCGRKVNGEYTLRVIESPKDSPLKAPFCKKCYNEYRD